MQNILTILFLSLVQISCIAQDSSDEALTIFLFRHAEKDITENADKSDPILTEQGDRRAQALATLLSKENIDAIFSSNYARTRDTVKPLARDQGLDIQIYDPRDLPDMARKLKKMTGKIAVSGHSNTTPALVELLSGEPGSPIDEASEYDRLYIVTIIDRKVSTVMLKYPPE